MLYFRPRQAKKIVYAPWKQIKKASVVCLSPWSSARVTIYMRAGTFFSFTPQVCNLLFFFYIFQRRGNSIIHSTKAQILKNYSQLYSIKKNNNQLVYLWGKTVQLSRESLGNALIRAAEAFFTGICPAEDDFLSLNIINILHKKFQLWYY